MGSFSYICRGCGKPICGEEKVVLLHVRHGEEVGRAVGTYYDYGEVEEIKTFRGVYATGLNTHKEMCTSEFDLEDSGTKSGISAWHQVCFKEGDLSISDSDPDQGWGKPRKEYKKENIFIKSEENSYNNYTISVEVTKACIIDITSTSEVNAKIIAERMLEENQLDTQTTIQTKFKVLKTEKADILDKEKENLLRELTLGFDNLSPNQIRQRAKEQGFNPEDILDEVILRKELL